MSTSESPVLDGSRLPVASPVAPHPVVARAARVRAWLVQRLRPPLRDALPALMLYYSIQAVGFAVLAVMANRSGIGLAGLLTQHDASWYLHIAGNGYDQDVVLDAEGNPAEVSLAFFPLYPAFVAAVSALGFGPVPAGLLVTLLAGGAAAWGLFVLGRDLVERRAGILFAGLWAMAPGAVVLHLVYSEALFVALAVWTLVALRRRWWLTAAVLTVAAGLTRITAVALIAAVCIAAVVALLRRNGGWRAAAALLLAPLGLLAHLGYVALRAGRADAWFWLQGQAWHVRFDAGAFTVRRLREALFQGGSAGWVLLVALVVLASLVLLLWSYTTRLPLTAHVYTTLVVLMALGSSEFWQSRPRFLLPAVTLVFPVAVLLARLPKRALLVLLPSGALVAGWFGAFLLTVVPINP
ncbi:hypothetical protein FHU38_004898 [Saccharomonospora amisosensis]|uniref:Dolichyl-phosphate-mannose-protein mannosyltransferase n=1 Tax=Saccharomonospora amisosensis TaxID=1128677 RepID=A0A7X5UVD6_9PSEU|nr:hypothetical protein [Saccharomonospora amisosensis]NIJ14497.1 hypothetical protein [Saccharomonospora amisosensis]